MKPPSGEGWVDATLHEEIGEYNEQEELRKSVVLSKIPEGVVSRVLKIDEEKEGILGRSEYSIDSSESCTMGGGGCTVGGE